MIRGAGRRHYGDVSLFGGRCGLFTQRTGAQGSIHLYRISWLFEDRVTLSVSYDPPDAHRAFYKSRHFGWKGKARPNICIYHDSIGVCTLALCSMTPQYPCNRIRASPI